MSVFSACMARYIDRDRKRNSRRSKRLFLAAMLLLLILVFGGVNIAHRALHPTSAGRFVHDLAQITLFPQAGFQGKDHIQILCIGVDDNAIVNNPHGNVLYGNSDTLLLMNLNIADRQASVLSIPRDCYAHIAGTAKWTKINHAYAVGGIPCTLSTVEEFLGLRPDYYICLSISGLKKIVNSMGGIDLTVENAMHYDDVSGKLHIHLEPGEQHLNGDQTLAFVRYRRSIQSGHIVNTPESGDQRRIYRQHVALRSILHRAVTVNNFFHCNALLDTSLECVDTDLTRAQLLDLAHIYAAFSASSIQATQLPAINFRAPDGGADLLVSPSDKVSSLRHLLEPPSEEP